MKFLRNIFLLGITIYIIIFTFTSCDLGDDVRKNVYFSIKNCTTDSIFVSHFVREHPDSKFSLFNSSCDSLVGIPPKGINKGFILGEYCPRWPNVIMTDHYEHQIMVFRKDTVDKYSKEELFKKNVHGAKYILSTHQIIAMDSMVKFPMEDYRDLED